MQKKNKKRHYDPRLIRSIVETYNDFEDTVVKESHSMLSCFMHDVIVYERNH